MKTLRTNSEYWFEEGTVAEFCKQVQSGKYSKSDESAIGFFANHGFVQCTFDQIRDEFTLYDHRGTILLRVHIDNNFMHQLLKTVNYHYSTLNVGGNSICAVAKDADKLDNDMIEYVESKGKKNEFMQFLLNEIKNIHHNADIVDLQIDLRQISVDIDDVLDTLRDMPGMMSVGVMDDIKSGKVISRLVMKFKYDASKFDKLKKALLDD